MSQVSVAVDNNLSPFSLGVENKPGAFLNEGRLKGQRRDNEEITRGITKVYLKAKHYIYLYSLCALSSGRNVIQCCYA